MHLSTTHRAASASESYYVYTVSVLYICVQGQDGSSHYLVQAKLAILNKQFKLAESILLERVGTPPIHALHALLVYFMSVPTIGRREKLNRPWLCTKSCTDGKTLLLWLKQG